MKRGYKQHPAGYTVVEILIAVGVVMILSVFIFAGTRDMMNNARLTSSTNKVLSTINLARNLAITHNAVYHVRIQNFMTVKDASGKTIDLKEQAIGVYCYPRTNDALLVATQDRLTGQPTETGSEWSSLITFDPTKSKNTRVEYFLLEKDSYIGIQYPKDSAMPLEDNILYFFPDGTASGSFLIFVTNEPALQDNPKRLTDPEKADWVEVNFTRYRSFYRLKGATDTSKNATEQKMRSNTGIQMIQVTKAGMVRTIRGGVN